MAHAMVEIKVGSLKISIDRLYQASLDCSGLGLIDSRMIDKRLAFEQQDWLIEIDQSIDWSVDYKL